MVSHVESYLPVALRGFQAYLQRFARRRAPHRRLLVRSPARHSTSGPHLRHPELPLLLRQHLPLGDSGIHSQHLFFSPTMYFYFLKSVFIDFIADIYCSLH